MANRVFCVLLILSGVIGAAVVMAQRGAASSEEPPATSLLELAGKGYYYRAWGGSRYACIYCHANFDEARLDDGYRRPGHMLWNAYGRPSFYNGAYRGKGEIPLARAINTCVVAFLQADALTLSNERMRTLIAYVRSISPDEVSPAITITRSDSPPEMDGDPRRGEALFAAACVLCHREKAVASPLTFADDTAVVLARIRGWQITDAASASGSAPPPPMPFFSRERLSDQETADLLAYWDYKRSLRLSSSGDASTVAAESAATEPPNSAETAATDGASAPPEAAAPGHPTEG